MEKWGGFLVKNVDTGRTDNMLAGAWRTLGGLQSTSKDKMVLYFVKTNKNPIQTLQPHTVHGTITLYFPEMAKKRVPAFLLQVCRR